MNFNLIKKILKEGFILFSKEKVITAVNLGTTIFISLFIWFGVFGFYFTNQIVEFLENRLDFSIYFKKDITRDEILQVQKILAQFPGVKEVRLITQEEALQKFQKEIKGNIVINRALTELQTNPLVDYLIVRAENAETYPNIADYLEKSSFKSKIDYVSYFENQKIIQRIINLSIQVKFLISVFMLGIIIFSSLIIFNTTYLSIYSKKEDIEVLRLIGAGNWFIRSPFFIYGLIFTFLGYIITLGILVLFLEKTNDFWQTLLSNFQPTIFLYENFFKLNGIILLMVVLINWFATFLSLEKYLKK